MELDPDLIDAWKWELSCMIHRMRSSESELAQKKVDFLEGFYSALTCLELAMSGERSSSPLSDDPKQQ